MMIGSASCARQAVSCLVSDALATPVSHSGSIAVDKECPFIAHELIVLFCV